MPIFANSVVSISDLKRNPSAVIAEAAGSTVAILNRNRPAAYLVSPEEWEAIIDRLEDIELARIVKERAGEVGIPVSIDDL